MDGVAGVTMRMAEIQSRLASIGALANTAKASSSTATATATGSSFASVYADALGASTATGSTKLNADGVPVDLVKYGNGKVPPAALDQIGNTGHRLWAPAANKMEAMMAAASRDGVKIGITDSYRPYAEQVDLAKRKGLYSQGGLAAKPGTSDHGWGLAVDLDLDAKAQAWMRANGAKFGFVENTPREPWHWVYEPKG